MKLARVTATNQVSTKRRWHEITKRFPGCSTWWTSRVDGMCADVARNGNHDPVTARETYPRPTSPATSPAATTSGDEVTPGVAIALASFVPTAGLSSMYSHRVATAFWVAIAIVGPIEILGIGPLLEVNHPLRVGMPAILGALAYSEMYTSSSSWPRVSRGYVMALLTFALAGVDIAALFFRELGGAWIVPGFSILVCTLICGVALVPKGRVSWLLS